MSSRARREGWSSAPPEVGAAPSGGGGGLVRWVVGGLALLVTGVLGTVGVLGYGAYAFASEHDGRILPGAVIAGVEVGGMTEAQALAAVSAALDGHLAERVAIRWGEERWDISRAALGASTDAEEHVRRALDASSAAEWSDLMRMRWHGQALGFTADVSVTDIAEAAREFVFGIAHTVHRDPVDAALDWDTGWVSFHPEQIGRHVDVDGTVADMLEAFAEGGGEVDLRVHEIAPDVTMDDFGQVLLLRQSEHQLYLYEGGAITASWPVAVGARASGYPTPRGVFEVTLKRYLPTWINPAPNGWGAGMPAQIGPGPGNPLGVRALNWSIGAIRFHGTADLNSIGRDASKGCVRLSNPDVIDLYDRVDQGAMIISI